jgi:hypothetical protein
VDGTETEIAVSGRTTASRTVTGLTAGKSHSFTIAAVAGSTESTQSSAVTATPTLPAVSNFAAAAGVAQVALSWTASTTTGVTGYTIRQTVDGTETEIAVSGRTTASRTVTGLTAGKLHSFTIAAVAGTAESTQSTAVTATPIVPPPPQNVRATAGINRVTLTWTASTKTEVTGYKIRQTVDGTETEIAVSGMAAGDCSKRQDDCKPYGNRLDGREESNRFDGREAPQLHHCSGCRQHGKHAEHCRNSNTDSTTTTTECTSNGRN